MVMERREFKGSIFKIAREAAEWLGCPKEFIYQSYRDKDFDRPRYFERHHQRFAILLYDRGVKC